MLRSALRQAQHKLSMTGVDSTDWEYSKLNHYREKSCLDAEAEGLYKRDRSATGKWSGA